MFDFLAVGLIFLAERKYKAKAEKCKPKKWKTKKNETNTGNCDITLS